MARDPELLRVIPIRALLRSRWLWGDNSGGEETFSLSRPATTTTIDNFCSRTWWTPGWRKMVGLAFYLNAHRAVVAAVLLHVLIYALEFAGVYALPALPGCGIYLWFADGRDVVRMSGDKLHRVLPMVIFYVFLQYGQELPFGRASCFLVKCCIHQTDEGKKAAGIKQLGAFLRYSKNIVVLWEPRYFTRLWCVYELAAFVYINDVNCRRVKFVPLQLSLFAIAISLLASASKVFFMLWPVWWTSRIPQSSTSGLRRRFLRLRSFGSTVSGCPG